MELTEQEVAKIVEEASSTRLPMLVSLTEEHDWSAIGGWRA